MTKDNNPPQFSSVDAASSLAPTDPASERRNRTDAVGILGAIGVATGEAFDERYQRLAKQCLTSALEAENAELRNKVVELALEILELQTRVRPNERSRWASIGA